LLYIDVFILKCMIQIEGYITMDTMVAETLENEGQRVSILCRMQIFIERMVGGVGMYAKHIRCDNRLHTHDVPDIHQTR